MDVAAAVNCRAASCARAAEASPSAARTRSCTSPARELAAMAASARSASLR